MPKKFPAKASSLFQQHKIQHLQIPIKQQLKTQQLQLPIKQQPKTKHLQLPIKQTQKQQQNFQKSIQHQEQQNSLNQANTLNQLNKKALKEQSKQLKSYIEYHKFSYKDMGKSFICHLQEIQLFKPSMSIAIKHFFNLQIYKQNFELPDSSWQTRLFWHLIKFKISADNMNTIYEYSISKITQKGYDKLYVLALLKLDLQFKQFLFQPDYIHILFPILPQLICYLNHQQLKQTNQLILQQNSQNFYSQQLLFLTMLLKENCPDKYLDSLMRVPTFTLLIVLFRSKMKIIKKHPIDLLAITILIDLQMFQQAISLLQILNIDPNQAKQYRQFALQRTNSIKPDFFSIITKTIKNKLLKKQLKQQPNPKSQRIYDKELGRWLINGKIPSDQQQQQEHKCQYSKINLPPPKTKQSYEKRTRKGPKNRYYIN